MENEIELRLVFFFGVLTIVALTEYFSPKRKLKVPKTKRWTRNLSLVIINTIAVRGLVPFTAINVAVYAELNQIGILHYLSIPLSVSVVISVLVLDLVVYVQHLSFHYIPIFWRFHKIHHIDQEIDVTTGIRFHIIEILLSIIIKCTAVLLLGVPFIAVVIFEIILNATAMFNHGNIKLSVRLDKWLRLIIVTPDMHRVHHSILPTETNSNFGFSLPWWDRVFRTYIAQPTNGHIEMQIGLKEYRDVNKTGLMELIAIPFYKK